jgi:hypothetical protein
MGRREPLGPFWLWEIADIITISSAKEPHDSSQEPLEIFLWKALQYCFI